ncbi:hypothetical protein BJY01DRAFT_263330 [Aspergillus pseudoustus]|uniref:Fungal-specific transcription factor domain-containing protein n=1 Tax=Aspergillus pseudoustus TaxID=1810923 RepID=A0ABR4K548_9EURO
MPSKRAIGPLDKRNRVSRCQACAARKIRVCHLRCQAQTKRNPGAVFVHHPGRSEGAAVQTKSLPKPIPEGSEIRFLNYSIALLDSNRFVNNHRTLATEILPLLPTSSFLRSAVRAVGALNASRHGSVCSDRGGPNSAYFIAFSAYSTSITALQTALTDQSIAKRDDVLWGTFFLGLFELMVDPSGEGWAKHMLSGTSKLLQLAGPGDTMTASRRTFFNVFRVLEATRAIIYGHNTILSMPSWMSLQLQLSLQTTGWSAMDEMISLMIQVSSFSARFFESIPYLESLDTGALVDALGREGLEVQSSIYAWHDKAMLEFGSGELVDAEFHLALACCHTLLLFLSNNYNYYPFWHDKPSPRLPQDKPRGHVKSILHHAEHILNTSDVSSVLLIFPLRVAGTQAESGMRARILGLLDGVFARGFVVARRIQDDLNEVWDDQGSLIPGYDNDHEIY